MTKIREAAHTVALIDEYCAHYRELFANVRNFEQFGKAFGCHKGQPMMPDDPCVVW